MFFLELIMCENYLRMSAQFVVSGNLQKAARSPYQPPADQHRQHVTPPKTRWSCLYASVPAQVQQATYVMLISEFKRCWHFFTLGQVLYAVLRLRPRTHKHECNVNFLISERTWTFSFERKKKKKKRRRRF